MHPKGLESARKRGWGHYQHQPCVPKRHFRQRRPNHHRDRRAKLPPMTIIIFLTSGNRCHMAFFWKRRSNTSSTSFCCNSSSRWVSCITATPFRLPSHQLTIRKFSHRHHRVVALTEPAATEALPVTTIPRKCRPTHLCTRPHLHPPHQLPVQLQAISSVIATDNFHLTTFTGRVEVFWVRHMRQLLHWAHHITTSLDRVRRYHRQQSTLQHRPHRPPGFTQPGSARWSRPATWRHQKPIPLIPKRGDSDCDTLISSA